MANDKTLLGKFLSGEVSAEEVKKKMQPRTSFGEQFSKNFKIALLRPFSTTGIVSLLAGTYHGYCDAKGIPIEPEYLETMLKYGPTVVFGNLRALRGAIVGAGAGAILEIESALESSNRSEKVILEKISKGDTQIVSLALKSGAIYGATGAAHAAIQTSLGYGTGYLFGRLVS